jgi:hypothetical protein
MANKTMNNAVSKTAKVAVAEVSNTKSTIDEFAKGIAKEIKAKVIKPKVEIKAGEGYKDAYSKQEFPSKEAFYQMKIAHVNSNFTKLDACFRDIIAKNVASIVIDVTKLGITPHVDHRLPRYNLQHLLSHLKLDGVDYRFTPTKLNGNKSLWIEFKMEKI